MGELGDMAFWSLVIPPGGKESLYEIEQTPMISQYVHVTNVAIPYQGPAGPHTLTVKVKEEEITIATLDKSTHPQHKLDFILDQTVIFRNHGKGPLHLLGYFTSADVMDVDDGQGTDDDDDDDNDYDEDEGGEDEDEDDDEAPTLMQAVANGLTSKAAKPSKAPSKAQLSLLKQDDEDDEGDEDDEDDEDEDDEGDEGMEMPDYAKLLSDNDLVMEYSSDVDEDDEGEDDDEGGEGEDEDDDEDEEEEAEAAPVLAKTSGKRPLLAVPVTPAMKKSKAMDGSALAQAPKSAPPKVQQTTTPGGTARPTNEKEYEAAIAAFLRSKPNKTATLAQLGTSVVRPAGMPKLGTWIRTKTALFKLDKGGNNATLVG